jgi:hypothetical protein
MKLTTLGLCVASAVSLTAACGRSQPADADSAQAPGSPAASVQVTPEPTPARVAVTPVDQEGRPVGQARVLQLTPVTGDPKELGLTPVPSGAN